MPQSTEDSVVQVTELLNFDIKLKYYLQTYSILFIYKYYIDIKYLVRIQRGYFFRITA